METATQPKDKNVCIPDTRWNRYWLIKRHLRGTPRPQVFPIHRTNQPDTFIRTIRTGGAASYTEKHARDIIQINSPKHSNNRIYDPEGSNPSLNTMQGGNRQPKIVQRSRGKNNGGEHDIAPTLTSNSYQDNNHLKIVAQRGRGKPPVQKLEPRKDELTNTLTSVQKDNMLSKGQYIRRLTPMECERLQGFSDNFTKYGIVDGEVKEISDSQRYKMMGNAVTTNVIQAIFERIFKSDSRN